MGRYRKILAAFDGSESAVNALKQAIKLARDEQCWIKAVTVIPPYAGEIELTGIRDFDSVMTGKAEKTVQAARAIADSEGAAVITGYELGDAHAKICETCESESCDLIMIGRRGKARLERALLGSVTARVIGHSQKDVLVVPRGTALEWGRVLVAVDGSGYSMKAAKRAVDFASSYKSVLHAVSVVPMNEELYAASPGLVEKMVASAQALLQEVKRMAAEAGVDAAVSVREGEPYQKILEQAEETRADIIFVGSHGRTGLTRLLMGSVAEKVIGNSGKPVMVVK